jgi:hypothetical protein
VTSWNERPEAEELRENDEDYIGPKPRTAIVKRKKNEGGGGDS